jgi:hypothetical protein
MGASNNAPVFFKNKPQSGKPISMRGLAEGLAAIEKAVRGLSIKDGHVEWGGGVPRIVYDGEKNEHTGTPTQE